MRLFLDFLHQCHAVLKADFICSPHLSGGGIAHAVEDLVEYINLLLAQSIFKGDTELVKLVRELGRVNISLAEVVKCKRAYVNEFESSVIL